MKYCVEKINVNQTTVLYIQSHWLLSVMKKITQKSLVNKSSKNEIKTKAKKKEKEDDI